jgi:death-on-curing protein
LACRVSRVQVAGLESALLRIENWAEYGDLNDVFGIAAMYAVAIARGHIFNDGNKRIALVAALTYLKLQDIDVARDASLEDEMVAVAEGVTDATTFANRLAFIALGLDDFDVLK